MRESSDGREAVPVWSVAQRVFGAIDGVIGTIVDVSDVVAPLVVVQWNDGKFPVVYPQDTIMIRRAFPWE